MFFVYEKEVFILNFIFLYLLFVFICFVKCFIFEFREIFVCLVYFKELIKLEFWLLVLVDRL